MPSPLRRILFNALAVPLVTLGFSDTASGQSSVENIDWSSSFFATNKDSTEEALDAGYSFYLGVFNPPAPGPGEDAWEPTPANTSEWAAHWITADATAYNPVGSNFSSSYTATTLVEGVSLTGKQGYIWGVNRQHPDSEWILVTDPTWIWPAAGSGGIGGFGASWTVAASTPVLGQVEQAGVHMQTAPVTGSLPPLLRSAMWLQSYFTQAEIDNQQAGLSGWMADPNNNGRPNLLEFAFGTHPRLAQRDPEPVLDSIDLSGDTFQTLLATINPNSDLTITAEVSADLVNWFSDGLNVTIESQSPGQILFRDLTPRSPAQPFRAIRIRATLP